MFVPSTSASRGEDVHDELETKDRNVIMLLLFASFLFCINIHSNWKDIEKKMGGKDHYFKNKAGAKISNKSAT